MTATAPVIDVTRIVDSYIDSWNETDPAARRALIARTWTVDGHYLDPLMSGVGHDGIDAMIAGVQAQFPGFRFQRISDVDGHGDQLRFSWALGPEGGEALAGGVDFGLLAGDRLQSITGFLEFAPGAAEE
jgi:hypothetical protein